MDKLTLIKILECFFHTVKESSEELGGEIRFVKTLQSIDDQLSFFYDTLIFKDYIYVPGEVQIEIISIEKLEKEQEGWFLIRDKSKNWVEDHKNWNKDWIVFAMRYGDAIFYNKKDGSIRGTIDKYIFFNLSNSLGEFIKIITDCLILEEEKYNFKTTTDDEETLPEYIADVEQILNANLDQELHADFMKFFFG